MKHHLGTLLKCMQGVGVAYLKQGKVRNWPLAGRRKYRPLLR